MSDSGKDKGKGTDKEGVERRKSGDRRISTRDRRDSDRVVSEVTPRRQKPDRRKNSQD